MKLLNASVVALTVLVATNAFASAKEITCSSMGSKGLIDTQTVKMPAAFMTLKLEGGKSASIMLDAQGSHVIIDIQRKNTPSEIKEGKREYAAGQIGVDEIENTTLTHFETRFDSGSPVGAMIQADNLFIKCGI